MKEGHRVLAIGAPSGYEDLLEGLPESVSIQRSDSIGSPGSAEAAEPRFDIIHVFSKEKAVLSVLIPELRDWIVPHGMIWASWPKKASKVETDVSEDVVRGLALQNGLVDVKVCAVDEVWSGLKLVIPVKDRPTA
jgi:hypothetical protein